MGRRLHSFFLDKNNLILVLLIVADLVYFGLHFLAAFSRSPKDISIGRSIIIQHKELFYLNRDHGYAEFFQYIKYIWILISLLVIAIRRKQLIYGAWIVLFSYLLLDDFAMLHEILGVGLASVLKLPSILFLEARYVGQIVYAVLIVVLISLILIFAMRKGDERFKKFSKVLVILLVALGVAAIGLDAMNDFIKNNLLQVYFNVLEDGSEMIIVSIMTWWVYTSATASLIDIG
jgi:hypothetical protein